MTFVDSNIPMYLVGSAAQHKTDAQRAVEKSIVGGERLVTSAEVLQEILHRYRGIQRLDAVQPAFNTILGMVDEVFPVEATDVLAAKDILLGMTGLSSRDALHVAVMRRRGVPNILSFDTGFDQVPGITRVA